MVITKSGRYVYLRNSIFYLSSFFVFSSFFIFKNRQNAISRFLFLFFICCCVSMPKLSSNLHHDRHRLRHSNEVNLQAIKIDGVSDVVVEAMCCVHVNI